MSGETHDLGRCRLRPLDAEDAAWAAPLLAGMDPWLTLGSTAAGLAAYLTRPDPALRRFVIDADGRAGVLCLRQPWLRGPYVELLAVTRPGAGLGRTVLAWAAANAGGNLWACVSAFNQPARRFYAKCGFAEVAVLPGLVKPGFDEILLRLETR